MKGAPEPLRTTVIGTGALGRHHVRILSELPGSELVGIYDLDRERAERLAAAHDTVALDSVEEALEAAQAAVVAVPTKDHLAVAGAALRADCHVLVEKPITASVAEADELIALADRRQRVLGVGHVEFYNPAVQALLGLGLRARFVEIQRLASFSPRSLDVDVVLDLMIHDLQILHSLDRSEVHEVRATGIEVLTDRVDIANVRVELASGLVANLTASRVSGERVRKLRVFSERSYHSLDYGEQEIKEVALVETVEGRTIVPRSVEVAHGEPLKAEARAFLAACRGEETAFVDGRGGRRALATAEAVLEAMSNGKAGARGG